MATLKLHTLLQFDRIENANEIDPLVRTKLLGLLSCWLPERSVNPRWKNVFLTHLPIRITVTFLSRKSKFNQFRIKAEPFFFSSRFGTPFMMSRVIWKTCFIQSLKVLMLIKIPFLRPPKLHSNLLCYVKVSVEIAPNSWIE